VWRHLPLNDVHPHAQLAAEAAEAAAAQGAFWEMHDLLLEHQDALEPRRPEPATRPTRPRRRAVRQRPARRGAGAARVADDVDSADLSGVTGTPTFFINGAVTTAPTTSGLCPRPCAPQELAPCSSVLVAAVRRRATDSHGPNDAPRNISRRRHDEPLDAD
jgi:hypothetical protein